jgi:predicted AAA+ superfamily ATPase
MEKNEIIKILYDWNFWDRDLETGIERGPYVERLLRYLNTDLVCVVTGARRSGKSYIMRQAIKRLIDTGVERNEILMINFEDPRFPKLNVTLLQKIYETYLEFLSPKETPYIFLDEVQEVEGWEKWVRTMREIKKGKIVVSGSNAKLLSKELATLLTGLHIDLTIFPLSFKEFLSFNDVNLKNKLEIEVREVEIKSLLRKYFEFGSFPEVVLNKEKKEILMRYYDDVINKDLIKRYKIRKVEQMKSLSRFYLTNVSNLTTFSSLEKHLNISTDTIEKFSEFLADAYLLFLLKRFSFKVREQDKSPKKVYSIDTGLANTVGFRFSENLGRLAENIVFLELKRKAQNIPNFEIFYWKDEYHKEVDFVIKEGLKVTQLIQVCFNIFDEKTKRREIGALIKAMNEFELNEGIVITEDFESEQEIEGKRILFLPLWKWLIN